MSLYSSDIFWACVGYVSVMCWVYFEHIVGMFQEACFRCIWDVFWACVGHALDICSICVGHVLCISWACLGMYWPCVGHILDKHVSDMFSVCFRHVSAMCLGIFANVAHLSIGHGVVVVVFFIYVRNCSISVFPDVLSLRITIMTTAAIVLRFSFFRLSTLLES